MTLVQRFGKYKRRLAIQSKATTQDTYGQETVSEDDWSTDATVWGDIEPLTGREYIQAQQVQADITHKVTMRYYSGLTPRHRISYDSRTFNIVSVINTGEWNMQTVAMCKEVV